MYSGEHQNSSDAGALVAHKLALGVEIAGLLTKKKTGEYISMYVCMYFIYIYTSHI